jgi:hypothetical protein
VYNEYLPILTGACVAAALMVIEHLFLRHLDFRWRYVLGLLAYVAGICVWAWRVGDWRAAIAAIGIVPAGGVVILAYAIRAFITRVLASVREAGRIEGRVQEANRATGVARARDD